MSNSNNTNDDARNNPLGLCIGEKLYQVRWKDHVIRVCLPSQSASEKPKHEKAHKPLRTSWISQNMCLSCLITIQSLTMEYTNLSHVLAAWSAKWYVRQALPPSGLCITIGTAACLKDQARYLSLSDTNTLYRVGKSPVISANISARRSFCLQRSTSSGLNEESKSY